MNSLEEMDKYLKDSDIKIISKDPPKEKDYLTKCNVTGNEFFDKQRYSDAHKQWSQYWDWKNNRNEARAKLEEDYGFDTKHVMHLVRLYRMGVEALKEGTLIVRRPDRDELLGIRNGSLSYDEVIELSEKYEAELESLYNSSKLQDSPDSNKIEELMVDIYLQYWSASNQMKYRDSSVKLIDTKISSFGEG